MEPYRSEDAITQNLKDAGCGQATIQIFLADLHGGEAPNGIQLLENHRRALLDILRREQKRIGCLDYLLFMLQNRQWQEE